MLNSGESTFGLWANALSAAKKQIRFSSRKPLSRLTSAQWSVCKYLGTIKAQEELVQDDGWLD
jgi:hypothetical protein